MGIKYIDANDSPSARAEYEAWKKKIADFKASHPDIEVSKSGIYYDQNGRHTIDCESLRRSDKFVSKAGGISRTLDKYLSGQITQEEYHKLMGFK